MEIKVSVSLHKYTNTKHTYRPNTYFCTLQYTYSTYLNTALSFTAVHITLLLNYAYTHYVYAAFAVF